MILLEGRVGSIKKPVRGLQAAAQGGQVRIANRAIQRRPYGTSCALPHSRTSSPLMNVISTASIRVNRYCNKWSSPFPQVYLSPSACRAITQKKKQCNKNCKRWAPRCGRAPCCHQKMNTKFNREASLPSLLLHVRNDYVCSPHL